jgi:putative drug exporter of the RND superfamily
MRRPLPVAAVTAAALVALGLPFLDIRFTTTDARALPHDTSGYRVAKLVQEQFPRSLDPPLRLAVHAGPGARLGGFVEAIRNLPERPDVSSPRYLGAGIWRVDIGAAGTSGPAEDVVRQIRRLPKPFPVEVGGRAAFLVDQKATLAAYLPAALAIVVSTTVVALFVMTGSVLLPLKAVLLNLLTLCAVFGALVLIFEDGHLAGVLGFTSPGAIDTTQPILIAALAFGLSTDYGVFLLTRIKEAFDAGADNETAVAVGLERTGRIVTAAALLFIVAIGAFASSRLVALKEIGVGTALAVAIDATVVRALLVPALMALLGRWNWWAPGPLRRLHARLGWGES